MNTRWTALFLLGLVACNETKQVAPKAEKTDAGATKVAAPSPPAKTDIPPALPRKSTEFGPSLTSLSHKAPYDLAVHTEVEQCAQCHQPIVDEWNASVHALASMTNPFYRFAFDDFSAKSGTEKLPFCGGCHDPALMYDQAIKQPVDASSVRAHTGVSCNTCHGVESVTADGNGSYVLDTSPIPIPVEGDDASLKAHFARVGQPALRTNELCVSCHRGFMSPETGHEVVISGLDEWGPFRRSGYNGNLVTRIVDVPEQNCVGCHMPPTADGHNSHRFAGGHLTLAQMTGDKAQIDAVEAMLKGAATIDVAAFGVDKIEFKPWDGAQKDDIIWFDVVVHNKNVGHVFPGGAQDLRDTWVEVELLDAADKVLAKAGTDHEKSGSDPTAYVLQAYMVDENGDRVVDHSVHGFRTPAFKHGINPKDSAVIRYKWEATHDIRDLKVRATLKHRRLTKTFQDATCKHISRKEDAPFKAAAKKFRGFAGDACAPQPVLELARVTSDFTAPGDPANQWVRHYQRGQGLAHHVSESLEEAGDAFRHALEILGKDGDAKSRAKTHFELGRVYGRQGRVKDAMDQYALAEAIVGPHPAIHFARGDAHHRMFHFRDAAKWYQEAAKLADDDRIWRELAVSSGSFGDAAATYEAARKGLAIEPRDPHLLRNQMLALNRLTDNDTWKADAKQAFSDFKRDEQAPNIQDECAAKNEECRKGRIPVPVIELK